MPTEEAMQDSHFNTAVVGRQDAGHSGATPRPRESTAIEDGFPFELVSQVAEVESWRKEVWRPVYHMHKWWAQRLGSVFRAAIIGSLVPTGTNVFDLFYQRVNLDGAVVYDPFMGSGTTVGEAAKLGCRVVGRDINAVAFRNVGVALSSISRPRLLHLFSELKSSVGVEIGQLYRSHDSSGSEADVLYWFWVKWLPCPECAEPVDLFSSRVFARHAYAKQNPQVQVVCPDCGGVFSSLHDGREVSCPRCGATFDQQLGSVKGANASCAACGHRFPIARTARANSGPPKHRLYAKLVLRGDGAKEYLPSTEADFAAYAEAERRLAALNPPLPSASIEDGHNTQQVLNYGYTSWDQFFNARQLLALTMLAQAINGLPAGTERDALRLLFSGVLEFNNMFASYKGEGTGAVRHMFSHHVLKPERTPIEANVWGTPKSSGSFSTLFRSRLLRALDYKSAPFELRVDPSSSRPRGSKVAGLSRPMEARILDAWPADGLKRGDVYLSCGDSAETDLPDGSVDVVVTDPPFFDNVHYSELADFFYVWQRLWFDDAGEDETTRNPREVQDTEAHGFASKLTGVFRECCRVLRDDGLLVFSYHHSREDGWSALARAVFDSGFAVVQTQPVKSEMSVAVPKAQAKSPIDVDVLMVCKKRHQDDRAYRNDDSALAAASERIRSCVERFNCTGRRMSYNDVRVMLSSQLLVELGPGRSTQELIHSLELLSDAMSDAATTLYSTQRIEPYRAGPLGLF